MPDECTRRDVLSLGAGMGAAAVGLDVSTSPAAATDSGTDSAGWLEGVDNHDGVVDRRGQSEVTVEVGTSGNGGDFGFGPAAVQVDPGATVVWKWTGKGGSHDVVAEDGSFERTPEGTRAPDGRSHDVVAEDGSFESEMVGEAGHTFERTFDSPGVVKYYCMPHRPVGMKGAVLVGDAAVGAAESGALGTDD
jgi:halocyanin-like protein